MLIALKVAVRDYLDTEAAVDDSSEEDEMGDEDDHISTTTINHLLIWLYQRSSGFCRRRWWTQEWRAQWQWMYVDMSENNLHAETDNKTNEVQSSDPQRVDSHLAAMIECYESCPKATEQSAREEDDIDSLREHLTRIPQIMDPEIYNIQVHVTRIFLVP